MTTTYNLLSKFTVGSGGASSITFSNIPQTFTDLKVVFSTRETDAQVYGGVSIQLNGGTTGYNSIQIRGDGSSATSPSYGVVANGLYLNAGSGGSSTSNTFGNGEFYIPNYTSSNQKSVSSDLVSENNATTAYATLTAGLSTSTSAVTSLTLVSVHGSFTEFTTAYLYGISNSSTQNTTTPSATGGDVITTDGTYWYHAFKYSGTFTPLKGLTADVLVVAGGGGGGAGHAGGGGAGGVIYFTSSALNSSTNYSCTIGAGGAGAPAGTPPSGSSGSNSNFASLTSAVGGGGGASLFGVSTGLSGGSGGGGAPVYGSGGANGTGGSATQTGTGASAYYGNNGGNGAHGGVAGNGGGGGGAGAVGSNATSSGQGTGAGGDGGAGINTYSSWLSIVALGVSGYIAGGGGGGGWTTSGGAGGSGGGGAGANDNAGYNATSTTGSGGGGGGGGNGGGGNGGGGFVIVRYAV